MGEMEIVWIIFIWLAVGFVSDVIISAADGPTEQFNLKADVLIILCAPIGALVALVVLANVIGYWIRRKLC